MDPNLAGRHADNSGQAYPFEQVPLAIPVEPVSEQPRPRPMTKTAFALATFVIMLFVAAAQVNRIEQADNAVSRRIVTAEVQALGQLYYALHHWLTISGTDANDGQVALEAEFPIDTGPVPVRVAAIVLYMAVDPERAPSALEELTKLIEQYPDAVTAEDLKLVALARRLVEQGKGQVVLDEAERRLLVDNLGWFGDLYITMTRDAPESLQAQVVARAVRTLAVIGTSVVTVLLLAIAGCVAWPLCLYRWAERPERLQLRLEPIPAGFYLEAFAAAMLFSFWLQMVLPGLAGLGGVLAAQLLSLTGMAILVRTREPARRWLYELGLHRGKGIVREVAAGVGLYAMLLPVLFLGTVFTSWLADCLARPHQGQSSPLEAPPTPMHPIMRELIDAGPSGVLAIVLASVVLAPLTEEIIFRGALYRFVRGSTARWVRGLSVLCSSLATGAVFGIVHPHWMSYLPLTLVGAVFSVGREWRGSLIAPMVAHAVHNGLLIGVAILLLA